MADETTPPNLDGLVQAFVEYAFDPGKLKRTERTMQNAQMSAQVAAHGAITAAVAEDHSAPDGLLTKAEDLARGAVGATLAHVVAHMLGIEVPASALRGAFDGGERSVVGKALGDTILSGLAGPEGQLEPGSEGAQRLIGMLSMLTLTPWFEGIIVEWAASFGGMLHPVEEISKLGHELIDSLGLGRLARVALRPIAQTTIATPLDWKLNKAYRPQLLGAGEVIRQLTRGRWSREQVFEELARQGYSDDRIESLLAGAAKQLSIDDALHMARNGEMTYSAVVDLLREQGYERETAEVVVAAAKSKRLAAIHDDSLGALKRAYANRQLTDSEFSNFIQQIIPDDGERAATEVAAQTVRELNVQRLSHGEIRDAVTVGISSFADYRRWLSFEGYEGDDQLTLELLLRHSIDKQKAIAQHRTDALAERAAEKATRDQQRAAKLAQVEADRALKRRGSAGDLERAVVRGLIPIDRYSEVLRDAYDADTVDVLVSLVQDERQRSLAQLAAADDARKRAAVRKIDVGGMEAAVLADVLTLDEFRAGLQQLGFTGRDIDILAATLKAKKADREKAAADRRAADAAAARKSINLARFEQLVRKGVRTIAQYAALLTSLGYDEASRAGIVELLQLKIADDRSAAATRAGAEPALVAKGLSLDQFRRAVLLGQKTEQDYQTFLAQQGFDADAQALLAAELRDDIDQADAARQQREAAAATTSSRPLPLSTIRRAVQLGVVSPDLYQQRLLESGYSSDDVAIEMELLVTEIADVQAARARRDQLSATTDARGLSLAQVERAVKAGVSTIEDYRAKAIEIGYGAADVQTLSDVLGRELQQLADAQARHDAIAGELAARNLNLSQLEQAVKQGLKSIEDYSANLSALGYADDDVDLLVELLVQKLGAGAAAA